jgi:uncharacterized protein YgiM (DUF1202 family)
MLKLKKLLFFCTVLVFVLGLGTLTTYADSSKTGTVTATTLNLRSSAKTSSAIVGTVKEGAKLQF